MTGFGDRDLDPGDPAASMTTLMPGALPSQGDEDIFLIMGFDLCFSAGTSD